jgi:phospholipase/carboxylesterase
MDFEDRTSAPSQDLGARSELLTAQFIPQRYEPNYAYPLLVMFHRRGGDENQLVRSMAGLTWRNYVGLGIRGSESVVRRGHQTGFGWGPDFHRTPGAAEASATPSDLEIVSRALDPHRPLDPVERIEETVFSAVRRARRALHVHSERIYLVGHGEGAAVAFRLGLTFPERFAGVISLNGWLPGGFRAFARLKACRSLRILAVHGQWNNRVPIERARRDVATLRNGGLRVAFQSYPCGHRLVRRMLSDVDNWLINQCTGDTF